MMVVVYRTSMGERHKGSVGADSATAGSSTGARRKFQDDLAS